jgi:hypothetical protein
MQEQMVEEEDGGGGGEGGEEEEAALVSGGGGGERSVGRLVCTPLHPSEKWILVLNFGFKFQLASDTLSLLTLRFKHETNRAKIQR